VNCKICNKETTQHNLCPIHTKAYENIIEKYNVWRKALNTSWEEYLREIEKHSLAGDCAKEVAKYLINNGEEKDGKKI